MVRERVASWEFVPRWRGPRQPGARCDWRGVEAWAATAKASAEAAERELGDLRAKWADWLAPLGEISQVDWREFRPLRLEREEAWTDWLAHLLSHSKTGLVARKVLSTHPALAAVVEYGELKVRREVTTAEGERRADILIEWPNAVAHIEVKVGDRAFAKTFETSRLLEESYGEGRPWADFILLPLADQALWQAEVAEVEIAGRLVQDVTWREFAISIRNVLRLRDAESLHWRTWAHSFCGAIEQRLLGCEPLTADHRCEGSRLKRLAAALTQIDIMREAAR